MKICTLFFPFVLILKKSFVCSLGNRHHGKKLILESGNLDSSPRITDKDTRGLRLNSTLPITS